MDDAVERTKGAAAEILAAAPPHQVIAEAVQVRSSLEPDQIVSTQGGDEFPVVGQQPHQLGRREGGVQEKPDRLPATELPQTFGEWDQVIIMHPHQIAGLQHRRQRPREAAVDPHIPGKIAPRIADQRGSVME